MDPSFNLLAVIVASISAFLVGAIWYSPLLFEKPWRTLANIGKTNGEETGGTGNPLVIYGGSFLLTFLAAAVFHAFIGPSPELSFALGAGVSAGIAWAAGSVWITYLFEQKPLKLGLINGGYLTVQYSVFGLVFGLM